MIGLLFSFCLDLYEMLRFQVTRIFSKLVDLDSQIVKQPIRTYRKATYECERARDVKPKDEVELTPPPGVGQFVYNRNPRNLERLSIANKGHGWVMDNDGRTFWHKFVL